MLDAFIIKRIQEEKEKANTPYEQPSLEVDQPRQQPHPPQEQPKESNRGVAIIDFTI